MAIMIRTEETFRATVLFADLRGYTGLAETLPPAQVATLLDEFFGILAEAIERHGGQIYHVAGDAMMVGFGVRDRTGDGALDALAAGRAMLISFAPMADRWCAEFSITTGLGIGIHRGEVALAYIGPSGKDSPTLIGDTVNVAARLCGRARAGEVLFSASIAHGDDTFPRSIPGAVPFLHLPQYALRGRVAPLDIWCVPAPERGAVS